MEKKNIIYTNLAAEGGGEPIIFKKNSHTEYIGCLESFFDGDRGEKNSFYIEEGAEAILFFFYLGGRKNIIEKEFYIQSGARADISTIYFASDAQEMKVMEKFFMCGSKSYGRFSAVCLAGDDSRVHYDGSVRVENSAQKSDSRLDIQAFILGKKSECRIVPKLEILANRVRAGHAAATSKIQDDELFYLQSRGLTKAQSLNLMIEGIFHRITNRMSSQDAAAKILQDAKQKYEKLKIS